MMKRPARWTLADWLALEHTLQQGNDDVPIGLSWDKAATPTERRRAGLLAWLRVCGKDATAEIQRSFRWITLLGVLIAACAGASVVWGCHEADGKGINVVIFLVLALVFPWLIFLIALVLSMMIHGRGVTMAWVARYPLRKWLAGKDGWTAPLMLQQALMLRCAGVWQLFSAAYHIGVVAGLSALCSLRHVMFFWESTTTSAMENTLTKVIAVLASPWASIFPQAVPSLAASRWTPEMHHASDPAWWWFLVMAIFTWGALPRLVLAMVFRIREKRILARETFQSPAHRKLWRKLDHAERDDISTLPMDHALVIDVCGVKPHQDALRPLFLQRLRLNPIAWETAGLLDEDSQLRCADAIQSATGGIILLAPSDLFSPNEIRHLWQNIRRHHQDKRIVLYPLASLSSGEVPTAEMDVWKNFADSLNDENVEVGIVSLR